MGKYMNIGKKVFGSDGSDGYQKIIADVMSFVPSYPTDSKYVGVADTAKLIRKKLKDAYPNTKFSIRSKSYSGGASIDIDWWDGPTTEQVDKIVQMYSGSGFDGSIDLRYYITHWMLPDGSVEIAHDQGSTGSGGGHPEITCPQSHPQAKRVHFMANHVFTDRKYTQNFIEKVAQIVHQDTLLPIPKINCDDYFGCSFERDYTEQGTLADRMYNDALRNTPDV